MAGISVPSCLAVESRIEPRVASEVVNNMTLVRPGGKGFKVTSVSLGGIHYSLAVVGLNLRDGRFTTACGQGAAENFVRRSRRLFGLTRGGTGLKRKEGALNEEK
jgi:hypothetical protein